MSEIKSPDVHSPAELLLRLAEKRNQRRKFFKNAGGLGVGLGVGTILGACGSDGDDAVAQTPPPAGPSDADILNFALNLEYLEAQFYLAAIGQSLDAGSLTGTGTQGAVTGGAVVPFTDPLIAQYAREIAADERAHVLFLRQALGSAAVAQPALDIGPAFAAAAMAAGLGAGFNPYADDNSFLLGAYIFEDVGVTAYKGASPFITNKTFLEAAAGILAAEAYHAALIRTVLYARGMTTTSLIDATEAISNLRDGANPGREVDQGVRGTGAGLTGTSNIVPLDANGLAFSRSGAEVLNVVFLNANAVTSGGFFPAGVNGPINTSSAMA